MRCFRCGRFTARTGRVWVFTSRMRVIDQGRHVYGPGFDPIHLVCLKEIERGKSPGAPRG